MGRQLERTARDIGWETDSAHYLPCAHITQLRCCPHCTAANKQSESVPLYIRVAELALATELPLASALWHRGRFNELCFCYHAL